MANAEVGYATALARKHGFTYQHFNRLWDSYLQSWGGDTKAWGGISSALTSAGATDLSLAIAGGSKDPT
jgi:hypothetical protein